MKAAHLAKIERRRKAVLEAFLPPEAPSRFAGEGFTEIEDPRARLRELLRRVGGPPGDVPDGIRNLITAMQMLLEEDVPDLIATVRELQARGPRVCRYCGQANQSLLTPARVEDEEAPGYLECLDIDGCAARIARRKEEGDEQDDGA